MHAVESELSPIVELGVLDEVSIWKAMRSLLEGAQITPGTLAFELEQSAREYPEAFRKLFGAVNSEILQRIAVEQAGQPTIHVPRPFVVGQEVKTEGIPFDEVQIGKKKIGFNLIPDFLRLGNNNTLMLNAHQATCEMAAFNGKKKTDEEDGYEPSTMQKLKGDFEDGMIFLATKGNLEKLRDEFLWRTPQLDVMKNVVEECAQRRNPAHFDAAFAVSSSRWYNEKDQTCVISLDKSAHDTARKKSQDEARYFVVALRAYRLG